MFDIVVILDEVRDDLEPLGTKPKFWFRSETGTWSLFKEARPNTGEDWAEKIACELARLLGLPHVDYDLAEWRGRAGVVCQSFVPQGGHLEHGNELLAAVVPTYPQEQFYNVHQYTLDCVLDILAQSRLRMPLQGPVHQGITAPVDVFIGDRLTNPNLEFTFFTDRSLSFNTATRLLLLDLQALAALERA